VLPPVQTTRTVVTPPLIALGLGAAVVLVAKVWVAPGRIAIMALASPDQRD
jgi:hypothetical protein